MEQRITAPKGCKIDSVEHDDNSVFITFSEDKEQEVRTWDYLTGKEVPNSSVFFEGEDAALFDNEPPTFSTKFKGLFIDERHAKSSLAMAKISQLMPYFGGAITDEEWSDSSTIKYVIVKMEGKLDRAISFGEYIFLAFHTAEQRTTFLRNNRRLVKDYLMLD